MTTDHPLQEIIASVNIHRQYLRVLGSEPFRIFFPLGLLCSLVGVSHWLWYYLGLIPNYSGPYHGLFQIQGFELGFAAGFLMTALPRFMETPGAQWWEIALAAALLLGGAGSLFAGEWLLAAAGLAALLLWLLFFAGRRFLRRRDNPPPAFVLAACGLGCSLAGSLLLLWPVRALPQLGPRLVEQGLLLGLVMAVGSHLGPRLLHNDRAEVPTCGPQFRRNLVLYSLAGLLIALSFPLEAGCSAQGGRLLRALVTTVYLLAVVRLHRPPTRRLWHLYFLWLSFWCVPAGLWLAGLFPERELQALHLTFVGGFGSMTFFIATRVVVAHCGYEGLWQRNTWTLALVGWSFVLALLFRASAEFFLDYYFGMLHIAAGLWLAGALLWAAVFAPKLMPWHVSSDE